MNISRVLFALTLSLLLHAAIYFSDISFQESPVSTQKGMSTFQLNIVPSTISSLPKNEPKERSLKKVGHTPQSDMHQSQAEEKMMKNSIQTNNETKTKAVVQRKVSEKEIEKVEEETLNIKKQESKSKIPESNERVSKKLPSVSRSKQIMVFPRKSELHEGDLKEKGLTTSAKATEAIVPYYPNYSRRHNEQGVVTLSVTILSDGKPDQVTVIESSGYRRLDRAAMHAVKQATFNPAYLNGKSIASIKTLTFRFNLKDQKE